MERYRCKLCFKNFINGRALGGHMRSHVLNPSIPLKIEEPSDSLSQYTESPSFSSSSSSEEEELEENEEETELLCPKQSTRLVDPELYSTSTVLQDRESETESSKHPTRRRSKRIRNWDIKSSHNQSKSESEPASSISNTSPDEDVAYCLMMLSRDKWKRQREKDETDSNEDFDFNFGYKFKKQSKIQNEYKCETCDRVFQSYQALGGHRASHKKFKTKQSEVGFPPLMAETERKDSNLVMAEKKIHKCPFCFRVFASGQALGGHKRSHVASSLSPNNTVSERQMSSKIVGKLIDLNLPAPVDDDEISQVEVSAVSNGEFVK